jgi:predicted ATPase
MLTLRSLELRPPAQWPSKFPYSLGFLRDLPKIEFGSPITFLVGENGSGKSTFLEALACAAGSITVGSESVQTDPSLRAVRDFSAHLKLAWTKRTRRGFFMRAEDFFGYARKMAQIREDLEADLAGLDHEYQDRSPAAQSLVRLPYTREIGELQRSYGESLDSNSHGEAFFKLFQERFSGEGLYLLDEPEAPLSPTRQLSLIALLKQMVDQSGQFIIATHSPLLLAYPGAQILSFDGGRVHPVAYEDLEHVTVTRSFLNNPQAYLKYLLE